MSLRRLVIVAIVVAACGGAPETVSTTSEQAAPAVSASSRVVSGPGGAEVRLPPEADGLDVVVEPIDSLEGVFPTGDPAGFAGGVVLQPHGATFDQPVEITIPLTTELTPGRQVRLYYWDGEGTAWEETSFFATVQTDGMTAVGAVTHFSYYVLQPSAIEAEQDGVFGDIEGTVITLSTAGVSEAEVTRTVYDQAFAAVKARFPFDEPVPLDVPVVNGYNCYSPVGIFMLLDHGSIGIETPIVETVGDIDDVEFRIDYIREIDVTVRHRDTATGLDVENEVTGTLVANVYWRSQPPDLDVATIETAIWAGESTDVLAGLSCGGEPMESLELDYRLRSDPTFVELSESLGFTDPDGISTTTVSTTDLASGIITVEVEHFWTDQPGDRVRTITKTAQIAVGGLTGRWRVTGEETWRNCTDPLDNGTYGGTGEVTFVQNGDSFMGGGTFPRTSDSIEGEFRRTGRNTFEVSGTVEYVEDYDGWIVRGTSGFVGTGSIVTESIDFTWNGADSSGDTCTFTGKGTGVRQ